MTFRFSNLNWGVLSAVFALIGLGLFHFLAPQPTSDLTTQKKTKAEYIAEVDEKKAQLSVANEEFQELVWQMSRDQIGPSAMSWVSELARKHIIEVRSFRPQRTVRDNGVDQLSYLVTAEGSYPSIMEFLKEFESEDSLLAVKLIQISSIDGASDLVRASIGLVAYAEVKSDV